jgi:hypothetical protein
MKCLSCGADKDLSVESVYPYPEDECLCDDPIPQLLTIDCQGRNNTGYRMSIMCHDCWHRLHMAGGIDMWIGEACWESLNPVTPFAQLPAVKQNEKGHPIWDAKKYENG